MHLHDVWFILIAVLWTGYFFLEGFDFGVGILTRLLARDERERRVLINTIGPVWDGNEVWLLTAGGATFAAFPDWYATLFSGFYLPLFAILVCLIIRGVAFEYRAKRDGERWKRAWEQAIFWTSLLPAFLWGVAFANIVHGVDIDRDKEYVGGVLDLLSPYALLGGLVTLALFTFHGAVFTALKTLGDIRQRARALAQWTGLATAGLAAAFLVWTQAHTGNARSLAALVLAVAALLTALALNRAGREGWAFVSSGAVVVAAVAMLFLALYPDVMPSTLDPAWSLTVGNAASSAYTLKIMTWVAALFTPLVLLYQSWTYWVFRRRIGVQHIPAAHPAPAAAPQAPGRHRPAVKPVDPRLLRHARATRAFLAASVLLGAVGAGLVIAQAGLLAEIVVRAFQHHAGLAELRTPVLLLAATAAGRAAVAWLTELSAHRACAAVKSELRRSLLDHATRLGPADRDARRTGELTALATRGVDALDDYFSRYLPQLALAVVVPALVLLRIAGADLLSAALIAATLPLIPLFMVLIGLATQSRTDRQWQTLARLSRHFLDVVEGLPTLKVFGRAKAQARAIAAVTDDYRRATVRTLRIAFISSFALELLSTLSVALVAVSIGFRLVDGGLDLETGLLVLILAPEAYLPIRQVGTHYHASVEGLAAADRVFAVLETPLPPAGRTPAPDLAGATLTATGLTVTHPGRTTPALDGAHLDLRPGETVALTGPSGAGKTTLLSVLLGFTAPDAGTVRVTAADGTAHDLADLEPGSWRRRIAWVPQHPYLFAGTVADNVRLARPDATDADVRSALHAAHALDFTDRLPHGTDTVLGEGGAGLSAGQRQRIALARAFLADDRPLVLLDEPTANLDGESEAAVVDAVRALTADPRRTVLLVAHRPALLAAADRSVRLTTPAPRRCGQPPTTPQTSPLSDPAPPPGREEQREQPPTSVDGRSRGFPRPRWPQGAARGPLRAWWGGPPRAPSALARITALARTTIPRGRLALSALLGSLALGSAVALLATSGWLISRASQQPPILTLMVAVTAVRTFGIGRSVLRYAERLLSHDTVLRALGGLRTAVHARLERLAPAALHSAAGFRRGDLLSRLVSDVDAIEDWFLRWRLPAVAAVTVSAAASLATALLLPAAGAVLAAGLLLAGAAVPALSGVPARRTERRTAPARGALATGVVDLLTGTAELTAAGALPRRLAAVRATDAELTRLAARSAATVGLGSGLTALVSGLTVAAAAAVGVQGVASGALPGVCLAVVVLTPPAAFEAVAGMPVAARFRGRSRAAAARLAEVLDTPDPVGEPEHPAPLPADPLPVAVRGLHARWPGQDTDALAGLDLDLAAGSRVAVVGPSGSGKTTLAAVLLRFLDPTAGSVTLGGGPSTGPAAGRCPQGVDSRLADGDDVRRVVGLCAQDAHVFDSSLRENLRLARPAATDPDLRAALAAARLLTWVDSLPQGLDTMVGEHGARMSGGQRQRLALARALLADFPVLVLDEPAEHLDLPTADALTADLLDATAGRTTLLITHRLAGLADADVDEVLVLDRGRVVQRGPWAELVAQDGPLRRMWQREQQADLLPARSPHPLPHPLPDPLPDPLPAAV